MSVIEDLGSYEQLRAGRMEASDEGGAHYVDQHGNKHYRPNVNERNGHARADEPADLFRRWSMQELLAADRTFRWLVRGMFVVPTYGMTAGEMKALKSTVSTITAVSVAAGVRVLDQFDCEQKPVVVYIGEGGRVPYTRTLERVALAIGVDLASLPIEVSFETAPITSTVFQETLARDLRELEPGLVVVDPYYAFHGAKTDARNLHEEATVLNSLSEPITEAGAVLDLVNHFNQSGGGNRLQRITMAGGGEWVDSWRLLSHREEPDVEGGRFRLLLEIGSRQWGGSTWNLDIAMGRFNAETGLYDGAMSWEVFRPAGGSAATSERERVVELVAANPLEYTREELARVVGIQLKRAREMVANLQREGRITPHEVTRNRSDGRAYTTFVFAVPSEVGTEQMGQRA